MKFKNKTKDGREVRIYATDGIEPYPIHGAIKIDSFWRLTTWTKSGSLILDEVEGADLIPVPDLKRDDPVIVWQKNNTETFRRYFSHFNEDGDIVCFENGKTSWTTDKTTVWDYYKLTEDTEPSTDTNTQEEKEKSVEGGSCDSDDKEPQGSNLYEDDKSNYWKIRPVTEEERKRFDTIVRSILKGEIK